VYAIHTRLEVEVGATDWYSAEVQVNQAEQTRSLVAVGATVW
jgi:uncharacterized protein YneR